MPLARNWTACSGVLFNYFQCSGFVFFVQLRLCNQRLLRSFRLRSIRNGGGVRFRKRPPAHRRRAFAHTPYGTRMFAKVRRTNLLLISKSSVGLSAGLFALPHALTSYRSLVFTARVALPFNSRFTPVLMHPTLSLNILRSRYRQYLVQRSHQRRRRLRRRSRQIRYLRGHGIARSFLLDFLRHRGS